MTGRIVGCRDEGFCGPIRVGLADYRNESVLSEHSQRWQDGST